MYKREKSLALAMNSPRTSRANLFGEEWGQRFETIFDLFAGQAKPAHLLNWFKFCGVESGTTKVFG